jgi:exonuclease III
VVGRRHPDILCLVETKMSREEVLRNPIELEGYQAYWNCCRVSAGYSGLAVFSKFMPLSVQEDLLEP